MVHASFLECVLCCGRKILRVVYYALAILNGGEGHIVSLLSLRTSIRPVRPSHTENGFRLLSFKILYWKYILCDNIAPVRLWV